MGAAHAAGGGDSVLPTEHCGCLRRLVVLNRVARVRIAVGAGEVEEVGVNEGDDILGGGQPPSM